MLPTAIAVLLALFALQPLGTTRIGRLFGPVMTLWFVVIGLLGAWGVIQHPAVLAALDPRHAIRVLTNGDASGFMVLGGVFLCVTGAEALYADMGHVGARPIRVAWFGLVMPTLVLNYAGQTGLLLDGSPAGENIFYSLCPALLLLPLIILATLATVIASQSIISGAFSMTRQAIQLGWCPPLRVTQTSEEGYGQIYVGTVNWLLMIVTLGLALGFGKSDNLAAAYGIAVSVTMLLTTVLLFIAMREIWRWSLPLAAAVGRHLRRDRHLVRAVQRHEDRRGWLGAVAARGDRVGIDGDLASRHGRRPGSPARPRGADGAVPRRHCRHRRAARARYRRVHDPDDARGTPRSCSGT